MLAATCPHCGAPTPVSLASPETIACQHCGRVGRAPEAVATQLHQAAIELQRVGRGRRQLTALQRSMVGSRALGCLHAVLLFLLTAPFVFNSAFCLVEQDTPTWVTAASLAPIVAMVVIGGLGSFWMRRARSKLVQACSAVPPKGPGHAARCHVCGAPIQSKPDDVVVRCSFCQSDNIVSADAMRQAHSAQQIVLDQYEQSVRQAASSLATTTLVSKLAAIAIAVVAPAFTILVTVGVGLTLDHIRVAPNHEHTYALWPTGDGRCLGRIRTHEDETTLTFNATTLRGIREPLTVKAGTAMTTFKASDLVGKQVFHSGGVGTVKSVFRTLGSKSNQVELDVFGEVVDAAIPGLCMAMVPLPEQLARLESHGSSLLSVDAKRVYWRDGQAVRALPKGGGAPIVVVERTGAAELLVADATHLFIGETGAVVSIDKATGQEKKLAGTGEVLSAPRDMCLDATHVYYALQDGVWRVPKAGGARPVSVVSSPDAFGLVVYRDELLFHSAKAGSVQSVPVAGGTTRTLASGLKLASGLPMFVVGDEVSFVNDQHQLMELPFKGGIPKRVVSFGEKPDGYARKGNDIVFWVNGSIVGEGGGVFHTTSGSAGKPRNLAPTTAEVDGLAIDDGQAYWLDDVTQRLMRVTLPKIKLPTLRKPVKRAKDDGKD